MAQRVVMLNQWVPAIDCAQKTDTTRSYEHTNPPDRPSPDL